MLIPSFVVIYTAAVEMLMGKDAGLNYSRTTYHILTQEPKPTGQFFIDDAVLTNAGVSDLDQYICNPEYKDQLNYVLFVDDFTPKGHDYSKIINKNPVREGKPSVGSTEGGKVAGLFKKIENTLSPKVVESTQAVYQFVVTGEEEGTWYINLKSGSGSCGKGEPPQKSDATLTMDSKHFFDMMFSGKLKPALAFMTGKLKISGNMQKALKLGKLMGG